MLASTGPWGAPGPLVQGLWRACLGSLDGVSSSSQEGGQRRLRGSLGQGLDDHQGSRCLPKAGVELRIWLKQGKEKAQTRKGKKTAGKEKRLLARKKDCWQGF